MPEPQQQPKNWTPPSAAGARTSSMDQGLIARVAGMLGGLLPGRGGASPSIAEAAAPSGASLVPVRQEPTWNGPGTPMAPQAPKDDVAGRAFDFPFATNANAKPRKSEPIDFGTLRALADSYDLLRLAIETRKDQVSKLAFSVLPRKRPDESVRRKPDERSREVEKFLRKPDRLHYWDQWIRLLVEDQLVIDAASIYKRKDRAGRPYAAEIIDGATVHVLLDKYGRPPIEGPAYQQILKGVPAVDYTRDELLYAVRNPRPHKVYGLSPTEQVVLTVNIGLRRMTQQLMHYTDGNIPEALIGTPESWTPAQIHEFQRLWDSIMENPTVKRRAKFVPGDLRYQPTRADGMLMDAFDEWLARIICYAFSLPPLPFVKVMNRATAQTAYDAALEEGLAPMMTWLKNIVDELINSWFGYDDLELVWDDVRKLDPTEQQAKDERDIRAGLRSMDEVRAQRGDEPLGIPHIIFGIGPLGFMPVSDVKKAIEQGLTMPQSPMPPDMMPGMMPGEDPLAGADPALLAELGIGPEGMPADHTTMGEEGEEEGGGEEGEEGFGEDEEEPEDGPAAPPAAAARMGAQSMGARPPAQVGARPAISLSPRVAQMLGRMRADPTVRAERRRIEARLLGRAGR